MTDRESKAERYGFSTFQGLLAASFKLPRQAGELMQSYVAKHPNGHWFVWESRPDEDTESTVAFPPDA